MNIHEAAKALEEGKRITRAAWKGLPLYIEVQGKGHQIYVFYHDNAATSTLWYSVRADFSADDWEIYTKRKKM